LGGDGADAKTVTDRMTVNLRDPPKVLLSVIIMLQTDSHNVAKVEKAIDSRHPMLENWLTAYLSDKTLDDVRGRACINRMRREIRDEFNRLLFEGEERIRDVHFEEFHVREEETRLESKKAPLDLSHDDTSVVE
jgi:flagellar basal body-associated protein FliL